MGKSVIALVAVAAALVAPSSLAQVVLSKSVFHTVDLPSNTTRSLLVSCPRAYVAARAGISNPAPGVTLLGMRPFGVAGYRFRFGNPAANADQHVTVVAACRSLAFKSATRLKVTPVQMRVKVPGGQLRPAALPCPSNTLPAGWGGDIALAHGARGYVPGAATRVSLRTVSMGLGGFSFSLRNTGTKAQSVILYGTCLTVLRPAGTSRGRLQVRITTFPVLLQPGSRRVVRSCATGWVSLAAGYVLRSPATTIDGVAAIGASGRWWVASDAEGQAAADLKLVCARLSLN
jgi:hypothetical protein